MMVDYLGCPHCGCEAVESDDEGLFGDGSAECMTCGFPGHVHADEEAGAWWSESDEPGARCTRPDCEDCRPEPAP